MFFVRRTLYHRGVQREIVFTGIGGQGVQLAARTLAEAATIDGRRVQLFASYGGMMRGGNSDSFVVISDEAINSPPVLGSAWAALVMHHEHASGVWPMLREGSVAAVNTSVVDTDGQPGGPGVTLVEVPALDIAAGLGAPVAASLLLLGALVAHTGLVRDDSLLDSAERVLPSYRAASAEPNRKALAAGLDLGAESHPAWELTAT